MRRPSQKFVFQRVYDIASMVEECVANEESLIELDWGDPELLEGIANFSKVSLLHRYIYTMIAVEHRYEYRKNADVYEESPELIRGIEDQLRAYGVTFLPYEQHEPLMSAEHATGRDEYPFHGWFLSQEVAFEQLWEKLTDEAFHLLFGNRAFLLRFNRSVASYIQRGPLRFQRNTLDETGCIRRVYLPVWVRDAVYFRDHGRCVLCQVDLSGLLSTDRVDHFDHMVALAAHGVNDLATSSWYARVATSGKGKGRPSPESATRRGGRNSFMIEFPPSPVQQCFSHLSL